MTGPAVFCGAPYLTPRIQFFSSMRHDARAQLRFRPSKIRPVDPHTVQNHADPASERDLGPLQSAPFGTSTAQRFSAEKRVTRDSRMFAAS